VSADLQEFNAGILTGLTWKEAQQQYPELCQALETQSDWVPIPAAETPWQGRDRAARFIRHLLATHSNGETVWVISHHWILEHLIANLMGCERTWQLPIPHTALFEFWIDRDRWWDDGICREISDHWQIKHFADVVHLSKVPLQAN
jgi:2,3-bisphosphoglycerate-dependent phosphoglycerate mutase